MSKKKDKGFNFDVKDHPVSFVQWAPLNLIRANEYNPNTVAKPEMELLKRSIEQDGYTQPIVVWQIDDGTFEVVDGFHRHLVAKEFGMSHAPVVVINKTREDVKDRMASTIRHNRARGKHKIHSMSDIVVELSRRCWSDKKIGRELGMDEDEVLRLKQLSGLAELFNDEEFSNSWEI
jgi:ParB-like chromosome segregation protein Spo0J